MAVNKIDPTKVIKVCSVSDGAIDKVATGAKNWEKYQTSYNVSLLKFKEGQHPTYFMVKNVSPSDEAKIKQYHYKIEFPEISNKTPEELKKIDIKSLKPKVEQVEVQAMMVKYFDIAIKSYEENSKVHECTANMFEYQLIQELGSFVLTRTSLGDDLKND